jgi:putative hemin transport protein
VTALAERWQAYRAAYPRARQRDVATALGVTEGELVAAGLGAPAVPLAPRFGELLEALASAGEVMALTRNEHVVSEVTGRYGGVSIGARGAGLVLGEHIDLRVFLGRWAAGFAVSGPRPSLQFFDAHGMAVHKVFLGSEAQLAPLVARFAGDDGYEVAPRAAEPAPRPDEAVDAAALRARWDALEDTHELAPLLHELGVARTQALRLAGTSRARRVAGDALDAVLRAAAAEALPLMIFAGNRGCIQIRSGAVDNIVVAGKWLNVLDRGFNLHVDATGIDESWVVHKPARGGVVTSLELYDAAGRELLYLFHERHDRDRPEDGRWAALCRSLEAA